MYVLVVGLRGFPNVQGGIETHAEELYPRLAALGCRVEVTARRRYLANSDSHEWRGVTLTPMWSPAGTGLETLVHSLLATLYAGYKRPDVLHLHAVGPALMAPLARLLGLNVVVTHHGPDYDREKWSPLARGLLQLGERWGMRWAQSRIVISKTIRDLVARRHHRDSDLIVNGVPPAAPVTTTTALDAHKVAAGRYVLQVSRLVPEKRQLDLVQAFQASAAHAAGWHLVIVGALVPEEEYTQQLQAAAAANPQILLTDFQTGTPLVEFYSHAGAFVLPSSHEGLPIALLEALSYGLRVYASDIPANLEVNLAPEHYFPLGSIAALTERLDAVIADPWTPERAAAAVAVTADYDWDLIAEQTLAVYQRALTGTPTA